MTLLTISSLETAKDNVAQLSGGEKQLIGVGIMLPCTQKERNVKIALIDVTAEVNEGRLDTTNPQLVNAFIHLQEKEIYKQINEQQQPVALHAAVGY